MILVGDSCWSLGSTCDAPSYLVRRYLDVGEFAHLRFPLSISIVALRHKGACESCRAMCISTIYPYII